MYTYCVRLTSGPLTHGTGTGRLVPVVGRGPLATVHPDGRTTTVGKPKGSFRLVGAKMYLRRQRSFNRFYFYLFFLSVVKRRTRRKDGNGETSGQILPRPKGRSITREVRDGTFWGRVTSDRGAVRCDGGPSSLFSHPKRNVSEVCRRHVGTSSVNWRDSEVRIDFLFHFDE